MTPVAVLIGAPGSGKSTVGPLLAARLGTDFTDTDDLVAAEFGMSVAEVFVSLGEQAFRDREAAVVRQALAERSGVVAIGGGAASAEVLAGLPVVWLRVGLAEAVRRTGVGGARPLALGSVRAALHDQLLARDAVYATLATWTVDTDGRSPEQVADQIVETRGGSR